MLFLRVCEQFDNDDEKWQTLAKLLLVLQALLNLTVVPHQSVRLLHHHVEKHGPDTERVNETGLFHTRVASHRITAQIHLVFRYMQLPLLPFQPVSSNDHAEKAHSILVRT